MSVESPSDLRIGESSGQTPAKTTTQAVPDYPKGFSSLRESQETWLAYLLREISSLLATISRWEPAQVVTFTVVVALALIAVRILDAKETLGAIPTLTGVLSTNFLIAVVSVISLNKHANTKQHDKGPPSP